MDLTLKRKQNKNILRIASNGCNPPIVMLSGGGVNADPSICGSFATIAGKGVNVNPHIGGDIAIVPQAESLVIQRHEVPKGCAHD